MSKAGFEDLGFGLLWLPGGLLFIAAIVAAMFLIAHDSPSLHLTPATYHAEASH